MQNKIRFGISDLDYVGIRGAAKGGNRTFAPPPGPSAIRQALGRDPPGPSAIRQALGRKCTLQADQGENGNLQL